MNQRLLRLTALFGLAGSLAVVSLALLPSSSAHGASNLLGWTAQADANTFDFLVDNAGGLEGSHPLTEIDVPEDFSNYATGPLGYARATVLWPGALVANLGSLAGEVGIPSEIVPLTDKLNDPVAAASYYPEGPATSTYPSGVPSTGALEMTSAANANQSTAKAALADISAPALFDLQGVQGSTTTSASTTAQASSSGSFSGLSLLGGLIKVGATTSTASVQSDGTNLSGTSTDHLGAITIAGDQVSFGSDGLVVGPASASTSSLLAIPAALVNQVINQLNLHVTPLPQAESSQSGKESITSGGLSISFTVPQGFSLSLNCPKLPSELAQLGVVCTLPTELDGFTFTFTVGRVFASAVATPPLSGLSLTPGTSSTSALTPTSGTFTPIFPSAGTSPSEITPATSVPTTLPHPAATPPPKLLGIVPVSLSSPVGVGISLGLLALALLFALGLRRLPASLRALQASSDCPHEEAQ